MSRSSTKLLVLAALIMSIVMSAVYIIPPMVANAKSEKQALGREVTEKLYNLGD